MTTASLDRLAKLLASRSSRRESLGLLAATGLFTRVPDAEEVAAKKRRKKRPKDRCRKLHKVCVPGEARRCCKGTRCDQTVVNEVPGNFCCHPRGTACTSATTCCSGACDFLVGGGTCMSCRGRQCGAGRPCCGGLECREGYCDGCRDRATSCTINTQCCFSNCENGACLSKVGGPCERDVDCRSCYLGGNCANACVNGTCAV